MTKNEAIRRLFKLIINTGCINGKNEYDKFMNRCEKCENCLDNRALMIAMKELNK